MSGQLNVETNGNGDVIKVSRSFSNIEKVIPTDLRFSVNTPTEVTITRVTIPRTDIGQMFLLPI